MTAQRQCSRCGGTLQIAFLADKGERGSVNASKVLAWISGNAEKGPFGGAKVLGKQRRDVQAFRCKDCGHLDLFVD